MPPAGFESLNLNKQAATDSCLSPHSHWDSPFWHLVNTK